MLAFSDDLGEIINLDDPEDPERLNSELEGETDADTARSAVLMATTNALTEGNQESMRVFLDRLVHVVKTAGASPGLEKYATALRAQVDAYLRSPEDPFAAMFEIARDLATSFYAEQQLTTEANSIRCEVSVAKKGSLHGLARAPEVGGGMRVMQDGILIRVRLTRDSFWRREMCAIPYVLLHELIVHAFAASDERESGDSFADGWMDFVVHDLHWLLASERLPAQQCPLVESLPANEQRFHAKQLHSARAADRAILERGTIAAETALNALASQHGEDRGRKLMWAFSSALNQSDMASTERSEACEQLSRMLSKGSDDARAAARGDWVAAAASVDQETTGHGRIRIARDFASTLLGA
jgi:hypothetical protein